MCVCLNSYIFSLTGNRHWTMDNMPYGFEWGKFLLKYVETKNKRIEFTKHFVLTLWASNYIKTCSSMIHIIWLY